MIREKLKELDTGDEINWNYIPFGDLTANFDTLRIPVKEPERKTGPYPYYGASGIIDWVDGYIFDGEYLLIAEDGENLKSRKMPIAFMAKGKFWVNNHAHIVRGNSKADTLFLMYVLRFADVSAYLTGSTMPKLTQGSMNKILIYAPPLPEQKAVASILGALDDKIEMNRKMNETLEAMARAIFKSWFVDFDPIPGFGPHKEWQDSPLGRIPQGSKVGTIGDIIELAYGKALKEDDRQPGQVPVYGSNGQVGCHNERLVDGPGIVVGRKGNPGIITWVPTDFYPIDTTFYVVPRGIIKSVYYLCHALKLQDLPSLGADSAVPGLNRNMAYMNKMIIPPSNLISAFDKQIKPLADKVNNNYEQSLTLAAIRDALLPKLLSEEIRVKDAERFVGEAI
jgi:type I restriction enzyme S subunit